jgi:hypothetical protein
MSHGGDGNTAEPDLTPMLDIQVGFNGPVFEAACCWFCETCRE